MRLFVLLFSFLFNYSAFAAAPITEYSANGSPWSTDKTSTCEPGIKLIIGSNPRYSYKIENLLPTCKATIYSNGAYDMIANYSYQTRMICPDGSAPDHSKPFDQLCPDPPPCSSTNGKPLFVGQVPVSSSDVTPLSVCENKCLYASSSMKGDHVGISGKYWFVPHEGKAYVGTGSQCTSSDLGSPTSPESELAQKLKQGYCPGQVNGVDVYVKCSSVSADTPTSGTSTTQKADGSTVKTDSKSTTTCEGGSCNTTTTTTNTTINPDGSTAGTETKTDTKTEAKETFCKENPTFTACVPSGFSASSCGAAPSCTGDAIQCAIAQQQHKSYCELTATPTAISELGVAAANGEAIPADHPLAQAEASPFNFSSAFTGASGGGGCPADATVMGVTVPLSNTCEGLNALGLAALGISLIWAARVVFGG